MTACDAGFLGLLSKRGKEATGLHIVRFHAFIRIVNGLGIHCRGPKHPRAKVFHRYRGWRRQEELPDSETLTQYPTMIWTATSRQIHSADKFVNGDVIGVLATTGESF